MALRAVRLIGWLVVGWLLAAPGLAAQELHFFRIATGSAGGTYFPVGAVIASVISSPPGSRACELGGSCGVPGLVAVAQTSTGSVANVTAVGRGLVDSGLAQADVIDAAYHGTGIFRGQPLGNLRAIANLYPESLHVVVRKAAGIRNIRGLAGKRVSLDRAGSGTRINAEIVLAAHGLGPGQLTVVDADAGRSVDLMLSGALDAFFFVAGYPAAAVADLAMLGEIELLPIDGAEAERLLKRHRFFSRDRIPAGVYEGLGATPTVSIGAQWVTAETVDAQLVYDITTALWHPQNRELLNSGHVKASQIRLDTALSGVSIPLHPGAARYYREAGVLPAPKEE